MRIMIRKLYAYTCCLLAAAVLCAAIFPAAVFAKELTFEASVNRNVVPLGQSIQLNLQFQDSRSVPAPELPDIDGFQSRYTGPSTMMSIVNGRMSSSITHMYRLVPLKTGKFRLGPFTIKHEGDTYTSNQLLVEVIDASSGRSSAPQRSRSGETSLKDRLFLTLEAGKSKVYLNEMLPVTIKLYIGGMSVRDVQYPEFGHEGFSVEPQGEPKQYKTQKGGNVYDVIEFSTSIFGTKPGEFVLGPATLRANLILRKQTGRHSSPFDDFFGGDPFDGFFGRYEKEPIELKSERIPLTVLPVPEDNRPSGFTGAVGNYDFNADVSPLKVKAGDPLTLKMTVSGSGNFSTISLPGLKELKNFKIYEPQVRQEGNEKIFEQILIPLDESAKEVPAVSVSFFNTDTGRYRTITKGPFPVEVLKPEKKEEIAIYEAPRTEDVLLKKEKLGRDIIYIKESPGNLKDRGEYLYKHIGFLLSHLVPLAAFAALWTVRKRKERLSTDISYARRLKAPKKAKKGIQDAEQCLKKGMPGEFYDTVFNTLRQYIGNRFHLPSGGITADTVEHAFRDKEIEGRILDNIKNIFGECDIARYAPAELGTESMAHTLKSLKEIIDYLERYKG